MRLSVPKTATQQNSLLQHWPSAFLFGVVFAASLFGIWSRPVGFLASVWPANALMLVVLLRLPNARHWSGWTAGAAAFMAADLLTGAELLKAAILNAANLVSVGAAYLVLARQPTEMIRLRKPVSMLYVVLAATIGGGAAGILGGIANIWIFQGKLLSGFVFWWITEVVNYVAILPIFLSAPSFRKLWRLLGSRAWFIRRDDLLPALAVALSCGVALLVGGPGAIAFPILALLWCGLVYPVFLTAILTLSCSLLALTFLSSGYLSGYTTGFDNFAVISIRLGTCVIAIAPIMLAIVMRNHNELLARLRYISTHDSLTGIGNRAAFLDNAGRMLSEAPHPSAVMMIDVDHFKAINDTHGHASGDEVLREIARRIRACLRSTDQFGRMGGEEFAVFLGRCQPSTAQEIAERIRASVAMRPVVIRGEIPVPVTVSVGLSFSDEACGRCLDTLLIKADSALYAGKERGRNRVEIAG
ncbi:diguanylate cyclase [Pseudothauera nasutitermitis]|uniref:diguanylate cyclase n=1 Tax=Pseudothauera nasutitermitis TaxID=2565930 RepID=A0A4S4B0Q5_9RHOO|nr:GGDEF domain-containing protein [Pseudothauera nasutitermitis]THF66093.1 diguanylate cyclase [Pseudothauera nasutitermitis]